MMLAKGVEILEVKVDTQWKDVGVERDLKRKRQEMRRKKRREKKKKKIPYILW